MSAASRLGVRAAAAAGCLAVGGCAWWAPAVHPDPSPFGPVPLESATAPEPAPETGPLRLGLRDAVLRALDGNRAFAVARYAPERATTDVDVARAEFDPVLSGGVSGTRGRVERLARTGAGTEGSRTDTQRADGALDWHLPTGTDVRLEASTVRTDSSLYSDALFAHRVGVTVTQALLQGAGLGPNLAALRQAELDVRATAYELRGVAEALVADVERTYWDAVLARRRIVIFEASLALAEQQVRETQERVRVGALSEIELAAARTEVALRREDLINARHASATVRLRLLRLLGRPVGEWERPVELSEVPEVAALVLDPVAQHVAVAQRMRSDLNQARLALQRQELELVQTRDGLLPRLDVFLSLGKSGYANAFGRAVEDVDGKNYDLAAGLSFEWPIGGRAATAAHRRARFDRAEAEAALANLSDLVALDVHTAWHEVRRTHEQIAATTATRELQEQTVAAETAKFGVGRSTAFLVAQAQRDLVARQIAEVEAVVTHLRAAVDLYRLEGSLLRRRGIAAPGAEPIPNAR